MDLNKLLSGKYFFTVTTAIVFLYSAYAKVLSGEQIYGIITLVVAFYFGRKNEQRTTKDKV